MTGLEAISQKLGTTAPWRESGGVYWLDPRTLGIRDIARAMNEAHARFVTITAYQLPKDEGLRLEYHWDLDGKLLGVPFKLAGDSIESIYDLCEAVDWIEREIHEEYVVEFVGREHEPLLLREGDKPGVNLREEAAR